MHAAPQGQYLRLVWSTDRVSVIVPVRNEQADVEACLRSILAQTYPYLEVLVIDGYSRDATRRLVQAMAACDPRIQLLDNLRATTPAALNIGLQAAAGRWLVRVDGHSEISPDYVERVVRHLSSGRWAGVGGRKDGAGGGATGRAIAAALGCRFGVGNSVYHYGDQQQEVDHVPFGAYDTNLVRSIGGWDERLTANEDFELDDRLRRHGHHLLFDPAVRIRWHNRQTLGDFFRQYRRYGMGKAAVVVLRPAATRLRHLASPLLVLALGGGALVSRSRPRLALALVAPYAVALAAAGMLSSGTLDRAARFRLPAAFAMMHIGWGLGFWEGLLRQSLCRRSGR